LPGFSITILIFGVIEAAVGLRLVAVLSRNKGIDYFNY
jgi:NADH:ubiquinone oxidoreductase subunit K